jgi:hypothetical protein
LLPSNHFFTDAITSLLKTSMETIRSHLTFSCKIHGQTGDLCWKSGSVRFCHLCDKTTLYCTCMHYKQEKQKRGHLQFMYNIQLSFVVGYSVQPVASRTSPSYHKGRQNTCAALNMTPDRTCRKCRTKCLAGIWRNKWAASAKTRFHLRTSHRHHFRFHLFDQH